MKWYRLLTAGVVLGPAVTACGSVTQLVRHPAEWTEPLGPFGT